MYVSIFGQFCLLLKSSLWNISREKFFQVFKKSSEHSRDILAFSCELRRWVRSSGRRVAGYFCEAIVCSKTDCLLRAEQQEGRGYISYILDGIKRYFYCFIQLSTE